MEVSLYDGEYSNPFISTNADAMSDDQIVSSWSFPFFMKRNKITEGAYLKEPMSLVISGARGTGKTMMFKYYSFRAQAIEAQRKSVDLLKYYQSCGSISFYLKFDPYLLSAFNNTEEDKTVFTHFFELIICESYIDFIDLLRKENQLKDDKCTDIQREIYKLLNIEYYDDYNLSECIRNKIDEIYKYMNDKKMKQVTFQTDYMYSFKTLSVGIKRILCNHIVEIKDLLFLWVIDEGENLSEFQQQIINCFIKTLNSRENQDIYFRYGTREPELKTSATINKEEFLNGGRDYEFRDINYYTVESEDRKEYADWLIDIAAHRLLGNAFFAEHGLHDIRTFLGSKENQCEEAKKCAANKKLHFQRLLKESYSEDIYNQLKVKDNPLLEMMNIYWYKKGYSIDDIQKGLKGYLKNHCSSEQDGELVKAYKQTFSEKKVALLYLLLSKYNKEKKYYSFQTYSYLSVGNIYNFIRLCREAFDNAYFENREQLMKGCISIKAQHSAALSVAYAEIEKVKYIPKYGAEIYSLAVNLGNLFNEYHSDENMHTIEDNQFVVSSEQIYVRRIMNAALTWGVFQKKSTLQTINSTGNKGIIYTLNKIFCPLFGISYRSKGRNRTLIDEKAFFTLTELQSGKVSSVIAPERYKNSEEGQIPGQLRLSIIQEGQ